MPAWNEYKESSRKRGSLALELFAVESTPIASPDALKSVLPQHLDYQRKLEAEGKLFLAGPMSDDTGTLMEVAAEHTLIEKEQDVVLLMTSKQIVQYSFLVTALFLINNRIAEYPDLLDFNFYSIPIFHP